MEERDSKTYEHAINLLNSLQSNAAILEALKTAGNRLNQISIPEMNEWLKRINYTQEDINSLSIIHTTGTKGKGSTSAFCESIIRSYGFRTGLYTSPHLQEVRERIRLNGKPISKNLFAKYFFEIWDLLEKNKDMPAEIEMLTPMPTYFRFLTLVAFHVFKCEKVDATVLEVGIGGTYDATNVVQKPVACGIVSIGIDHEGVLGNTIASIAHHKGGICKENVPTFTDIQVEEASKVLVERSIELKAPLFNIPKLSEYKGYPADLKLGISGQHQFSNAALAIALSKTWLRFHQKELNTENFQIPGPKEKGQLPFDLVLSEAEIQALRETHWPGRCQTIILPEKKTKIFLDGAHTLESLTACISWFQSGVSQGNQKSLIFNCSFDRDPERLLRPLFQFHVQFPFNSVCFCPNIAFSSNATGDTQNNYAPPNDDLAFQKSLQKAWQSLEQKQGLSPLKSVEVQSSLNDALDWTTEKVGGKNELDLLITGSLHLVGATLNALKFKID